MNDSVSYGYCYLYHYYYVNFKPTWIAVCLLDYYLIARSRVTIFHDWVNAFIHDIDALSCLIAKRSVGKYVNLLLLLWISYHCYISDPEHWPCFHRSKSYKRHAHYTQRYYGRQVLIQSFGQTVEISQRLRLLPVRSLIHYIRLDFRAQGQADASKGYIPRSLNHHYTVSVKVQYCPSAIRWDNVGLSWWFQWIILAQWASPQCALRHLPEPSQTC